jgi:hypothetical protein
MADTKHTLDTGDVRGPGHGDHCRFQSHYLSILMYHSMVWSHMAYWLHSPESIYLGSAGRLHSSYPEIAVKLHLVCHTVVERGQTRNVRSYNTKRGRY